MNFYIIAGFIIIVGLGFYAGSLLFQLKAQNERQQVARQQRIDTITESIRTIAFAMEQQQCNLSEGAIRICNLLDAIPLLPRPDYADQFPSIHELYSNVQKFDTHEARKALSKQERRNQDKAREQLESEYETKVLKEIESLKGFSTTSN